jgi:uncharacterized protein
VRSWGALLLRVDGVDAGQVYEARGFMARLLGLMGRADPPPGLGLLIRRCASIHTCFMRYPLDVVYLAADGRVTKVTTVKPWRFSIGRGATAVIELSDGDAARLALVPGSRVDLSA